MNVEVRYFENEGYVDYGYYLFVDGKPETIPSQDPRYPTQLVFGSAEDAMEHVLDKYFNVNIIQS